MYELHLFWCFSRQTIFDFLGKIFERLLVKSQFDLRTLSRLKAHKKIGPVNLSNFRTRVPNCVASNFCHNAAPTKRINASIAGDPASIDLLLFCYRTA